MKDHVFTKWILPLQKQEHQVLVKHTYLAIRKLCEVHVNIIYPVTVEHGMPAALPVFSTSVGCSSLRNVVKTHNTL